MRASPTYMGHNPVALVGADATFRIALTIISILTLIGLFVPSEFYDGGGSGRAQTERDVRHCTYAGESYDTCFNQVMRDNH